MHQRNEETYTFDSLKSAYKAAWRLHRKGEFTTHIIKVKSTSIYGVWKVADSYLWNMRYNSPAYIPECVVISSVYFKKRVLEKYRCPMRLWGLYATIREANKNARA